MICNHISTHILTCIKILMLREGSHESFSMIFNESRKRQQQTSKQTQ